MAEANIFWKIIPMFWPFTNVIIAWTADRDEREAIPRKSRLLLDIVQKGKGGGSNPNPTVFGEFCWSV